MQRWSKTVLFKLNKPIYLYNRGHKTSSSTFAILFMTIIPRMIMQCDSIVGNLIK